jgi:type II secretory pathway pseudopilin PulG
MVVSIAGYSTKRHIRSFSLVELLVVILIIGSLMALGVGGYTIAQKKLAETRTRATMEKIKLALEAYKNKHGYYIQEYGDTAKNADGSAVVDTAGSNYYYFHLDKPKSGEDNLSKIISYKDTPFDDPDGYESNGLPKGHAVLLDSYPGAKNATNDNEFNGKRRWILYKCPAIDAPFELRSSGHDREFGTDDDIVVI